MGIALAAFGASGAANLSLSASNVSKSGSGFIHCGHPGSTPAPALSVSGGSGNYSFLWSRQSGTPTHGPWVCSSTTAQNPVWSAAKPVCDEAVLSTEVWRVECTDESSGQRGSFDITVSLFWADLR